VTPANAIQLFAISGRISKIPDSNLDRQIGSLNCIYVLFNPLNAELNPICHLLALLGAHHILHISRIRVKEDTNCHACPSDRAVYVADLRPLACRDCGFESHRGMDICLMSVVCCQVEVPATS